MEAIYPSLTDELGLSDPKFKSPDIDSLSVLKIF
jgi:hypothetical protein